MRIVKEKANIDYNNTKEFFSNRAKRFNQDNPYSVTMYQDNNPQLVIERNNAETSKLLPLLKIDENSNVLDVACGIGRWFEAIKENVGTYCGIDFSDDLIKIAEDRNAHNKKASFYVGSAIEVESTVMRNKQLKFNRVLIMGLLIYLNDNDVACCLEQISNLCKDNSIVCIREPIGKEKRLTLKNFYSEELKDEYNAIYRTREELGEILEKTLIAKGFSIVEEGALFPEEYNNRSETTQYYFLLKKE